MSAQVAFANVSPAADFEGARGRLLRAADMAVTGAGFRLDSAKTPPSEVWRRYIGPPELGSIRVRA